MPRSWDQPHAVSFSLSYRPDQRWSLNLSGAYHTGWPTTGVSATVWYDGNGQAHVVPRIEQRNGERMPYYLRIDSRVSRDFRLRRGVCSIFLEVMNIFNRDNLGRPEGFNFRIRPDGSVEVTTEWEKGLPVIPSLGVRWSF